MILHAISLYVNDLLWRPFANVFITGVHFFGSNYISMNGGWFCYRRIPHMFICWWLLSFTVHYIIAALVLKYVTQIMIQSNISYCHTKQKLKDLSNRLNKNYNSVMLCMYCA